MRKAEFEDRTGADETARLVMDVPRLNLAKSLSPATGGDQSRLLGSLRIVQGGGTLASYAIDVTAGEAAESRTGVLLGAAINSCGRFFRRLTDEFAARTYAAITA